MIQNTILILVSSLDNQFIESNIMINIKTFCIIFVLSIFLCSCVDPNTRASNIHTDGGVEKIKELDVVLDFPISTMDPKAKLSMNSRGWDSGEFANKFVNELSKKFEERGLIINTVYSKWGRVEQIKQSSNHLNQATYKMIIAPKNISYMVLSQGGVTHVTDNFTIPSTVTILIKNRFIWSAEADINVAPIDSTGADRFSISILNSMADSGLLAHAK